MVTWKQATNLLVTGGAGFIGSNFIRYSLNAIVMRAMLTVVQQLLGG